MLPESHTQSWIFILRDAVESWRKQNEWSRETAAQMIVDAHELNGMHRVSGIVFDPATKDAFTRMKVNADRVFRWLDDVTKDNNHLPTNFIPSILHALPAHLRMHAANRMLMQVGIGGRWITSDSTALPLSLLKAMLAEAADAEGAVASLVDGIEAGELEDAHRELTEAISAFTKARDTVETMMKGEKLNG